MPMTVPLPPEGDTSWYDWATDIHGNVNADSTKLAGVEAGADVTDAANVAAAGAVMSTGNGTVAGLKTFTTAPAVPDEAYGAGWNGSVGVPTKNAIYDKIEALGNGNGGNGSGLCYIVTDSGAVRPNTASPVIWVTSSNPGFALDGDIRIRVA